MPKIEAKPQPKVETKAPVVPRREIVYALRKSPGILVMWVLDELTIEDDIVISRKPVCERDVLAVVLSKMNEKIEQAIYKAQR